MDVMGMIREHSLALVVWQPNRGVDFYFHEQKLAVSRGLGVLTRGFQ